MKHRYKVSFFLIANLCISFGISSEEGLQPLAGEMLLSAAETDAVLVDLAAFKDKQCIKARIMTEVDDLLGARKEEGELLLDRSGRVLRKFTKPSLKIWLLDGARIQEYAAKRKMLYVKDFGQAPKALKLIQAAFTGDVNALKDIFDIHVFRSGKENQNTYRFVLLKKTGPDNALLYKRIQAHILENALFFHEIEYLPESGDRTVERYFDITSIAKPADAEFVLDLPADVKRKTEAVSDEAGGK